MDGLHHHDAISKADMRGGRTGAERRARKQQSIIVEAPAEATALISWHYTID